MKKVIASLIITVCTSNVYARSQYLCTYNIKLTKNANNLDDHDTTQLYREIHNEMKKKSYHLSNNGNGTFDFEFTAQESAVDKDPFEIAVNYSLNMNLFDSIAKNPFNKPYLLDASEILGEIKKIGSLDKTSDPRSYGDALRQLMTKVPDCLDIKNTALSKIYNANSTLHETVRKRKNDSDPSFPAKLAASDEESQKQYCVVSHTPLVCQTWKYQSGHFKAECKSGVAFKINGSSKIHTNEITMTGNSHDGFGKNNGLRILLNIPLVGIPKVVGSIVAVEVAEGHAEERFQKFISEFQSCIY